MKTHPAARSRGAASIEFSLAFVLLFLVFYGMVGYTVPLLLAASYQQIAADSLREAVALRLQPPLDGQPTDHALNVQRFIEQTWIPAQWVETCPGYPGGYLDMGENIWRVCLRHGDPAGIIPPFKFFSWQVPQLPDEIRGEATLQLR